MSGLAKCDCAWSMDVRVEVERAGVVVRGRRGLALGEMFGLVDGAGVCDEIVLREDEKRVIEMPLGSGEIVYVTGVSGSGKSRLLGALRQVLKKEQMGCRVVTNRDGEAEGSGRIINQLKGDVEEAMSILGRVGLGDVKLAMQRACVLSGGERMRLMLGKMMQEVGGEGERTVLLMDEYCSVLDRLTSKVVSRQMRKWVSRMGVCLVVATGHDDLLECLGPDVVVRVNDGEYVVERVARG